MAEGAWAVRRLAGGDIGALRQMTDLFGEVFEDRATYSGDPPGEAYLARLLSDDRFIALVVEDGGRVIGGLVAYVLAKFERERAEIYIYDLGTAAAHRRRGVATALIVHLAGIAADIGAHVLFVQADVGDNEAIRLYESLGTREEVLHFDIPPKPA